MTVIRFEAKLYTIGSWILLSLPEAASKQLPSRGQAMVEGTINDVHFKAPLEPDGKWGHWLHLPESMQKTLGARVGDSVTLAIESTKDWPEPEIPKDLQDALAADSKAYSLWTEVTPMARWEWVRWIHSTNSKETRQRRIEVACSKLETGKRRPCCWNRNLCTEPSVSKNGILLEPIKTTTLQKR